MTAWVQRLAVGPMKNFSWLVGPAEGSVCAVVDPAWDVDALRAAAAAGGRQITHALLTHHHHDHVNGVKALLEAEPSVRVVASRREVDFAESLRTFPEALVAVGAGQKLVLGGLPIVCIHTPGHTPGSLCYEAAGALFSGDTLFVGACGRCDFQGGDARQMHDSLHRVLGALPASTRLCPGHDYGPVPETTLGEERASNPYLQAQDVDAFLARRMGLVARP